MQTEENHSTQSPSSILRGSNGGREERKRTEEGRERKRTEEGRERKRTEEGRERKRTEEGRERKRTEEEGRES